MTSCRDSPQCADLLGHNRYCEPGVVVWNSTGKRRETVETRSLVWEEPGAKDVTK